MAGCNVQFKLLRKMHEEDNSTDTTEGSITLCEQLPESPSLVLQAHASSGREDFSTPDGFWAVALLNDLMSRMLSELPARRRWIKRDPGDKTGTCFYFPYKSLRCSKGSDVVDFVIQYFENNGWEHVTRAKARAFAGKLVAMGYLEPVNKLGKSTGKDKVDDAGSPKVSANIVEFEDNRQVFYVLKIRLWGVSPDLYQSIPTPESPQYRLHCHVVQGSAGGRSSVDGPKGLKFRVRNMGSAAAEVRTGVQTESSGSSSYASPTPDLKNSLRKASKL